MNQDTDGIAVVRGQLRLSDFLNSRISRVMQATLALDSAPPALLRGTQDPKFGDFQANGCMALAKKLGKSPRDIASVVVKDLENDAIFSDVSVAGPGFINLTLDRVWLASLLTTWCGDERHGVPPTKDAERIVIDYSSPNIAKQMHVGHLRSTIIGDAIARLYRFVGHDVIADNHIGDWGTQYGLLIVGMREFGDEAAMKENALVELERVYKAASAKAKDDEDFAEAARHELAKLQSGDEENTRLWKHFVATTRKTLDAMYARLDIKFDKWLGESAYHDMLEDVVEQLLAKGIAVRNEGAVCVFFNDLEDPSGAIPKKLKKTKTPMIIQKRDGAFLYSTSDIATSLYRKNTLEADRSVYVVDQRQALHFSQVFAVSALLGINMAFDHVGFGTILGPDGTPLKTRDGGTVLLKDLLDEACNKAQEKIDEGRESGRLRIPDDEIADAAELIGIGAVKYADLSQNRSTDYKFDFDKMISFSGNAAPYLQYQYARCRSIFENGSVVMETHEAPIALTEAREQDLALELMRFPDVIHQAAEQQLPHYLCDHLFNIAQAFSRFYKDCPVLGSDEQASRLSLTRLTANQLKLGLGLLGIGTLERM